jgi:hypothetical protein
MEIPWNNNNNNNNEQPQRAVEATADQDKARYPNDGVYCVFYNYSKAGMLEAMYEMAAANAFDYVVHVGTQQSRSVITQLLEKSSHHVQIYVHFQIWHVVI